MMNKIWKNNKFCKIPRKELNIKIMMDKWKSNWKKNKKTYKV